MRLGVNTPALDAKLLVGHALGLDTLALALGEAAAVSPEGEARAASFFQRRMSGESVARIIGEKEFYGLPFGLNPATLEPRPDTELLVELALKILPPFGTMLDLGTGTGCIPIAVLAHRPDARAMATDIAPDALSMARQNAERNGVADRLIFAAGYWFSALSGQAEAPGVFDLILSNPPYIAHSVIDTLASEVKDFDPRLALDGGPDGLAPYRVIAREAKSRLTPDGHVLVEIGYDQGEAATEIFNAEGWSDIALYKDLGGQARVLRARMPDQG